MTINIELPVVSDGPNEATATELETTAVADIGVQAPVTRTVIHVQARQRDLGCR